MVSPVNESSPLTVVVMSACLTLIIIVVILVGFTIVVWVFRKSRFVSVIANAISTRLNSYLKNNFTSTGSSDLPHDRRNYASSGEDVERTKTSSKPNRKASDYRYSYSHLLSGDTVPTFSPNDDDDKDNSKMLLLNSCESYDSEENATYPHFNSFESCVSGVTNECNHGHILVHV